MTAAGERRTSTVIAVDVGGTTIKASLIDRRGVRTRQAGRPTPAVTDAGQDAVIAAVLDTVARLRDAAPAAGAVGLVVPGVVDDAGGVAVFSENIGWHDIPFAAIVRDATGLPVGFGHDVRAAGVAEHRYGAGAGIDEFLFLPIGTGISAAMFTGGRLIGGALAGELGHVDVGTGRLCACGARGCLETIASARSIAREYNNRTGGRVDGAADVARAARAGDAVAHAVWDEAVDALADALAVYVTLLAPQCVAIGGGLSRAAEQLIAPLQRALDERLVWQHRPTLVTAALGAEAGQIGAALLAFAAAGHPLAADTAGEDEPPR